MFPLIGMKDSLENIREKWFPVAKKISFHQQELDFF